MDQDDYRRLVGQCFVGDIDVGLAMVSAGLVEAMLRYLPASHPISVVEYGAAENRARDDGLGIWSAKIESPPSLPSGQVFPCALTGHMLSDRRLAHNLSHLFHM